MQRNLSLFLGRGEGLFCICILLRATKWGGNVLYLISISIGFLFDSTS